MRVARIAVPTVLMLVSPMTVPAQTSDQWTGQQRAIAAVIERTEAANNAGDVEVWAALFAEDAVYMAPGAPAVTTRDGLVAVAEAGFRHAAQITIEPVEITVTGSWAFARNRVRGSVTVQGTGEVVEVDAKQIVIYRRTPAGEWRIARLISNSNTSS